MSNRTYQGVRTSDGRAEVYVLDNTKRVTLEKQLVLFLPPLEFEWGYGGKEPRNLALALLADALEGGDDPAVDKLYGRLLDETIKWLPYEGWQLFQKDIVLWVYGRISEVPIHPLPLEALGGGVPASPN
jgi:hypothetical protein